MMTNPDNSAPIDRTRGPQGVFVDQKIRRLGAAVPSAERQPTGSGSDTDVFLRQNFWGAHSS
jgi:hypothetical protein